jgi:hypothetical protein
MSADTPDPTSIHPELLTATQTAGLLNISPRLLWSLAAAGDLPAVRIHKCTRWRRADVLGYIARLAAPEAPGRAGA